MSGRIFSILVACLMVLRTGLANADELEFLMVEGAGGVPLSVQQSGNKDGPGILFIHGFSQSYISWRVQRSSALADEFHLVSLDLRGHGASGKPWDAESYASTEIYADDIAAVMAATGVNRPVLVGWSFGGMIVMDYIRHYGSDGIAGINFVGTTAGFGPRPDMMRDPDDPNREERATDSTDIEVYLGASRQLLGFLTASERPQAEQDLMVASALMLPAYVRRVMGGHPWGNEDVADRVTVPVLFTHGEVDQAVNIEAYPPIMAHFDDVRLSTYPGVAHSPFMEASERFNTELADFIRAAQ